MIIIHGLSEFVKFDYSLSSSSSDAMKNSQKMYRIKDFISVIITHEPKTYASKMISHAHISMFSVISVIDVPPQFE